MLYISPSHLVTEVKLEHQVHEDLLRLQTETEVLEAETEQFRRHQAALEERCLQAFEPRSCQA